MPAKKAKQVPTKSAINTDTLVQWRDRCISLHNKMIEQPDAEWAWLWRTRLGVLEYLIRRYAPGLQAGADESIHVHSELASDQIAGIAHQESTSPYDGVPNRDSSRMYSVNHKVIQARLTSLQDANAARHAEADKLAEQLRRLSQSPAERKKPDPLMIAQALQELDEREYKDLRKQITFDLGMTDILEDALDEETIRLILLEHGIERDGTE